MPEKIMHFLKSITEKKYLQYCIIIQSILLLFSIFYNYVGEESNYTYQSIQILYHHNLLDASYGRPPFYAWMIIAVSKIIGVQNILPAARIVCLTSFFIMSAFTYKLVKKISNNTLLAWYAVVSFYTVQMVAKLAWLSYADPLFGMLTFVSCGLLWMYIDSGKINLLMSAFILLFLAMLTKSFSCLIVFAVSWWVLLFLYQENRSRLYNLRALVVYALFAGATALFFYMNQAYLHQMLSDLTTLERVTNTATYLKNVFITAPFVYFIYATAPALPVAIYLLIRRKVSFTAILKNKLALACVCIFMINILPYWFGHHIIERRYLFPIYPFAAIFAGFVISVQSDRFRLHYCRFLLGLAIVLLCTASWLPFLIHPFNYQQFSRDVVQTTGPNTLYATPVANGYSWLLAINSIRVARYAAGYANVNLLTNNYGPNSYVFTKEKKQNMNLIKSYKIYKKTYYLYFNPD